MWISKKKFEQMEEDIKELKYDQNDLKNKIKAIISCHNFEIDSDAWFSRDVEYTCKHIPIKHCANTNQVKNVTLQELAQYVIDGKPIEREETVKVTKKYL